MRGCFVPFDNSATRPKAEASVNGGDKVYLVDGSNAG